jgi:Na+/proline symporter
MSIPADSDQIFAVIATTGYLPMVVTIFFVLGITAAAYSSADSALAALTTSFTIDILGLKSDDVLLPSKRKIVHLSMSVVLLLLILLIKNYGSDSLINTIYRISGYTYGPLLGLFAFGLFTKKKVCGRYVPLVALLAPILSWLLAYGSPAIFSGYVFGFEILLVNGLFMFVGLWLLSLGQGEVNVNVNVNVNLNVNADADADVRCE